MSSSLSALYAAAGLFALMGISSIVAPTLTIAVSTIQIAMVAAKCCAVYDGFGPCPIGSD